MNKELIEIQEQIKKLRAEMGELTALVNKNNFTSTQTFNKDCIFSSRLKVPVFGSAPTVAEISDLYSTSAGVLYICTTASTSGSGAVWTKVGAQ